MNSRFFSQHRQDGAKLRRRCCNGFYSSLAGSLLSTSAAMIGAERMIEGKTAPALAAFAIAGMALCHAVAANLRVEIGLGCRCGYFRALGSTMFSAVCVTGAAQMQMTGDSLDFVAPIYAVGACALATGIAFASAAAPDRNAWQMDSIVHQTKVRLHNLTERMLGRPANG